MASKRKQEDNMEPPMKKRNIASKLMAKMGYLAGQGLGRDGAGILNPIEVKLRPQGAGVGAVKEKTPQAKEEAKRVAERRGEVYEDSSEEERQARKRKAAKKPPPKKIRKRTATQIEAEEGLQVPNVFKSLVDLTGSDAQVLTSTAGLLSTSAETEESKLARRAQRELEHFASAWHELQERKQHAVARQEQLREEIARDQARVARLESLLADLKTADTIEEVTENLEHVQLAHGETIQEYGLSSIGVSSVAPLFKKFITAWKPLEEPLAFLPQIERLKSVLGVNSDAQGSPWEDLVYSSWLPKVQTAIQAWDITEPAPLLNLINGWRDVVPDLAIDILVNDTIVKRLIIYVKSWKPGRTDPYIYIAPWLDFLSSYQLDVHSSGLLSEVRRRLRSVFASWEPNRGLIPSIHKWMTIQRSMEKELTYILETTLLPSLARHLRQRLVINPKEQDVVPLTEVLQWQIYISPNKISRVLVDALFPEWLNTLHLWLTSNPNYDEIAQWIEWWQSQIPHSMSSVLDVANAWEQGLDMVEASLDGSDELPLPETGPARPTNIEPKPAPQAPIEDDASFRDVVENLCAEDDLVMVPLRKAHTETGLPIFRITASAAGTGGASIFIKGDVLWAQDRKNRSIWRFVDVFAPGTLASLAQERI